MKTRLLKKAIIFFIFCNCFFTNFSQNIYPFAGKGTSGYSGDGGLATLAEFDQPFGLASDATGNIYISDIGNHNIRKVNASGTITTVAGTGTAGFSGDGGLATLAQLDLPLAIATDGANNVYIADYNNVRVRKINNLGIINTIAGNGSYGFSGDGANATLAQLGQVAGIAVDAAGNIYISDEDRIRKINISGIINTIAGTGVSGFSGDGTYATLAQMNLPSGIAVGASGDIYFADQNNNRVRKINTSGIISTVAGNGTAGFSGDGLPANTAMLNKPSDVAIDAFGNLYITEYLNNRIRKVNTLGIISTIAGTGVAGFSGDGGASTSAQINSPSGIDVNSAGNFYFADSGNLRVRVVCNSSCVTGITSEANTNFTIQLYPNPSNVAFNLKIEPELENGEIILYNSLGQKVLEYKIQYKENNILLNFLSKGLYSYIINQNNQLIYKGKLLIE